jgi:hypothetical protein
MFPPNDFRFSLSFRRRVDWRLLPILGILYALALIDRTNISIARVVGLDEDLVRPTFQVFSTNLSGC